MLKIPPHEARGIEYCVHGGMTEEVALHAAEN